MTLTRVKVLVATSPSTTVSILLSSIPIGPVQVKIGGCVVGVDGPPLAEQLKVAFLPSPTPMITSLGSSTIPGAEYHLATNLL